MRNTNERGTYPSIMLHHSNYSQLAIGGAMLNRVHENEEEAEVYQCTPTGCGGWHTRFDGGNRPGPLDMPCDLVAMYVEGQINISGFEGAYDSNVVVEPLCYAKVMFRSEKTNSRGEVVEIHEEDVYLWSHFGFADRVRHDGVYDLKDAFETAAKGGPVLMLKECMDRHVPYEAERNWHLVSKKRVPGRIRQILHRTIDTVRETVGDNFGQGSKFFKIPGKKQK